MSLPFGRRLVTVSAQKITVSVRPQGAVVVVWDVSLNSTALGPAGCKTRKTCDIPESYPSMAEPSSVLRQLHRTLGTLV